MIYKTRKCLTKKCFVICGPTASGKSKLALKLANRLANKLANQSNGCVIINADSKQIIKELPILTDQPTEADLLQAPHKLYGYKSAYEDETSFKWCQAAATEINHAFDNGQVPILVGGSGFYIRNLIDGHTEIPETKIINSDMTKEEILIFINKHDPTNNLNPNDEYRMKRAAEVLLQTGKPMTWWIAQPKKQFLEHVDFIKIYLDAQKNCIYSNSKLRIDKMFPRVIDEVANFMDLEKKVIGFEEIKSLINKSSINQRANQVKLDDINKIKLDAVNKIQLDAVKQLILTRTMQYAKRQRTWFRYQMNFNYVLSSSISDNSEPEGLDKILMEVGS